MAGSDLSENVHWQNQEIENLLKIWSRKDIQNELESMHQNLPVYEKIAAELEELGIHRSATSCRDKIKKLKFKYRRLREKKGHRKGNFKFYDLLRSVLGDNVDEVTESPQQGRRSNQLHPQDHGSGFTTQQYPPDYDQTRYSPNVASNDSNSIILTDSDSDSDYDHYVKGEYGSDDDYMPDDSSHYSETQPTSSTSYTIQNPSRKAAGTGNYGNMFLHAGSGRVVTSSRQESIQRDDNLGFPQQMDSVPLNAARMTMKRRADFMGHMGRGCSIARGMMGRPFGFGCRGGFGCQGDLGRCHRGHHGHHGHRGGKLARMEQTFDNMLTKVMQSQQDTQERFLASHEKQLQQHLQFELQRQELINIQREEERKHHMNMFEMMVNSLHQTSRVHGKSHRGDSDHHGQDSSRQNASESLPGQQRITTMSLAEVKTVWRTADAVCFDVDSTVLKDEGVDELAKFCDVGQKVAEWTKKAMGGGISFRVALTERLNIIKPSRQQLHDFISQHPPQFSDGISDLVKALREKGKSVYLVSGGFRSIIEPAAKILSISPDHIFANKLRFFYTGEYAGFDESQPTSDSGGKPKVVELIKDRFKHKKLVMVGDGATDLEASPPADAFIGYGGNVVRDSVKSKAAWFVTDFKELITELNTSS